MQLPFKTWVARALHTGGVLALAEQFMRSRRNVVFTLHRVLPKEEMGECYNPHLATTPETFDHWLRWLRSKFAVVTFDELISNQASPSRAACCAVTFDDGWEDTHRVAFPIMQAHNVPALVYLVTGLIGTRDMFPEERFRQILRTANAQERARLVAMLPPSEGEAGLAAVFKELPRAKKVSLLKEASPMDEPDSVKFMDWAQVASLRDAGHAFGSHTAHHIILPQEDDATLAAELSTSKNDLASRLNLREVHFAFPSGRFDERTMLAVRAAGYKTAVTTTMGALHSRYNRFMIPRLPIDNTVVNDPQETFSPARARYSLVRGMVGKVRPVDYQ